MLGQRDPQTVGPYRLVARLGSGGMGQVYVGRTAGGRTVAVKTVRPEYAGDPEFRQRFRQEVAAARRVGGSWTAPVLDADTEGERPWVATGYVAGPSLSDAVRQFGPLPVATVQLLGSGMAEALASVHGLGLVHRDVKPSNVLLALDGPRLIDFGIARALDQTSVLTRSGYVVGSPGFMSPEQARGEAPGPAGDVFALGAVLAFAATGTAPFGEKAAPPIAPALPPMPTVPPAPIAPAPTAGGFGPPHAAYGASRPSCAVCGGSYPVPWPIRVSDGPTGRPLIVCATTPRRSPPSLVPPVRVPG